MRGDFHKGCLKPELKLRNIKRTRGVKEQMSTEQLQIAQRARKFKGEGLTNLHQFIDEGLLKKSYQRLNKDSTFQITQVPEYRRYDITNPKQISSEDQKP